MQKLHFDELQVGDCWESQARTITETDVVNFACLTGDFDPLHVDHEFAAQTPFGRPIAHGLLGLAVLAGLSTTAPAASTVAFVGIKDWKFQKPIMLGDTIHVVTKVIETTASNRRRGRVIWQRDLVNQNNEVVQSGTFETVVATSTNQATQKRPAA